MLKPNLDLILMPTFTCNMACDYCYILDKCAGVMEISTARRAIEQDMEYNDAKAPTNVYWHGAEPLLAGIDFFREICDWTTRKYGLDSIHHHIQTNGTLLNEAWYELFIQYHITTGISLDGPQELNDGHRKFPSGKGSFDVVFRNIMEARKKKLFFDVLCVITRETLEHVDELFDFFYENKIDFGFEPLVAEDQVTQGALAISPEEYAGAAIHLFDRWFFQADRRLRRVVPPYHFVHSLLTGVNSYCNFSACCARRYLAVSPNGDIHSCIMFAGEPNFSFGNITRHTLDKILCSPVRQQFLEIRSERIEKCRNCRWVKLCNSGCPHHALVGYGQLIAPDLFCKSYQQIFAHIERVLRGEITNITKSN